MILFFNDTATTEIYTLSLHDALPIFSSSMVVASHADHDLTGSQALGASSEYVYSPKCLEVEFSEVHMQDRKSTRLNSSHANISYAVFCLKKKMATHPLHLLP